MPIRIRLSIFDADHDPDPTPNFSQVGKSDFFLIFIAVPVPVNIVLHFSLVS
jgi:hypothetical protein